MTTERSRAGRWAWLPVLGVGVGLFIALRQVLVITGNPILAPALLVLVVLLIPVSFVVYVDGRDPDYEVPLSVLLSCALLGGVLGVAAASALEFDVVRRWGQLPAVSVGLIEEAAKLLVPIAVLAFSRYRTRTADGLLVGVAVGMCFALVQALGSGFVTLVANGGELTDIEGLLLVRAGLEPAGQAAWTGLAAAALWWARAQRWRPRGCAVAVGAFAFAVASHTFWVALSAWYGYLIIGIISFAVLVGQTHRSVLR